MWPLVEIVERASHLNVFVTLGLKGRESDETIVGKARSELPGKECVKLTKEHA